MGILQAKKLTGHFNCVIVSPLRRAKETLHYSSLTYNNFIINNNFSERIFNVTDQLILNYKETENDNDFFERVITFHREIEDLYNKYESILLIGAYFFNALV